MNSDVFTVENICILIDILKHCSVCHSQEVVARLTGSPRLPMKHKTDISTNHTEPAELNSSVKRCSTTYHASDFRPLPFSNTPSCAPSLFCMKVKIAPPVPVSVSYFQVLFQDANPTISDCLVPATLMFRSSRRLLPHFSNLWTIVPIFCLVKS